MNLFTQPIQIHNLSTTTLKKVVRQTCDTPSLPFHILIIFLFYHILPLFYFLTFVKILISHIQFKLIDFVSCVVNFEIFFSLTHECDSAEFKFLIFQLVYHTVFLHVNFSSSIYHVMLKQVR